MTDTSIQRPSSWWKPGYRRTVYCYADGELVCDDALQMLSSLREEAADLLFFDPPFNLGKSYGNRARNHDKLNDSAYFEYMRDVLLRGAAVLKPGGALYLYHLPRWAIAFGHLLAENGLSFRHWIAVGMKNGFARGQNLYPAHYSLLYYTKGPPAQFCRPKLPVPKCRHCGGDIKDYGGYRRFVEDGINLSDFWEDVSPVRHRSRKHRRSNELPQKIVSRVVEISGITGGLAVDPFAGSGAFVASARRHGMLFVGGDIERSFLDIINERLVDAEDGAGSLKGES